MCTYNKGLEHVQQRAGWKGHAKMKDSPDSHLDGKDTPAHSQTLQTLQTLQTFQTLKLSRFSRLSGFCKLPDFQTLRLSDSQTVQTHQILQTLRFSDSPDSKSFPDSPDSPDSAPSLRSSKMSSKCPADWPGRRLGVPKCLQNVRPRGRAMASGFQNVSKMSGRLPGGVSSGLQNVWPTFGLRVLRTSKCLADIWGNRLGASKCQKNVLRCQKNVFWGFKMFLKRFWGGDDFRVPLPKCPADLCAASPRGSKMSSHGFQNVPPTGWGRGCGTPKRPQNVAPRGPAVASGIQNVFKMSRRVAEPWPLDSRMPSKCPIDWLGRRCAGFQHVFKMLRRLARPHRSSQARLRWATLGWARLGEERRGYSRLGHARLG